MKYNLEELKILIKEAVESSKSMSEASSKVDMNFKTFRKYAKEFGLFVTNQSGKGTTRKSSKNTIPLQDILNGLYPQYQKNKLRKRLIKEGYKEHRCEICSLYEWLGHKIPIELHHKDGNPHNHVLSNLEILCPNCHAQTDSYRGKNIKNLLKSVDKE